MAQPSSPAATLSAAAAAYKELFPQRKVDQLSNRERDLMKWLPKQDDFVGYAVDNSGGHYHVAYKYAKPQGLSTQFTDAQTASGGATASAAGKVKSVKVPRKRYYGYHTIDEEAAEASMRGGAFYPLQKSEIEDLIEQVSEELEKSLWNGSNGDLGRISSVSGNPNVIVLTNPEDAGNFSIGMLVGFNTAVDGSGTDHGDSTAPAQVAGIDIDAGTVTLDVDIDSTAGSVVAIAANDYIFRSSALDVTANGDAGNLSLGIADWIPLTAETSGTFLEMDRTDDVQRLQGWRQADEGSIELTIKKLFAKMFKYSARPDSIWLSHDNWNRLEQELGVRAGRQDGTAATFGLPSLTYSSPRGKIPVFAASFMPNDRGYVLKRETWCFAHMGGVPHVAMADGTRLRYLTGADSVEFRVRWWGNLICKNMFHNGVFNITSLS